MGYAWSSHIPPAHISSCLILGLPQQETSSLWMEGFVQNSNSFQHVPQTTRSTPNLLRHPGQTWRISLSGRVSSTNLTFWLLMGKEKTAKQHWCREAIRWHVAVLERKLMNMTSNLSAPLYSPHIREESKISATAPCTEATTAPQNCFKAFFFYSTRLTIFHCLLARAPRYKACWLKSRPIICSISQFHPC